MDAELLCGTETIDSHRTAFGIRVVKLIRSEKERKFQFEINGLPIYVKGANWVPPTLFAGSATNNDYENLLSAAADANINMLRVWGGGYYETEKFYQLCDRLGIMVWQDFMFACGYYPDREWFIKDIEAEAAFIIKRLRNHPCIIECTTKLRWEGKENFTAKQSFISFCLILSASSTRRLPIFRQHLSATRTA
jgi:beta-mannosidase